jgi:hypothetical protein
MAVVLVNPPGFTHAGIFREITETMYHGLCEAGVDAVLAENTLSGDRLNLVFAGHLLAHMDGWTQGVDNMVLFNLEQIRPSLFDIVPHYRALLERFRVWDYDARNVRALADTGIHNVEHVPLGFCAALCRVPKTDVQDIDVLFYGSPTPRRLALRERLAAAGLRPHFSIGVYGKERDALIARSKVVINPSQFDEGGIFDIVRLSYLLANRKAVVMEGGIDAAQEKTFEPGVVFADIRDMPQECNYLCTVESERAALERRGFELFSGMPQSALLAPALRRLEAADH